MIIKKYLAKTEEEAIRLAREELGSQTVIMNVKKRMPRGIMRLFRKASVEVTAAIDEILPEEEKKTPDFEMIQKAMEKEEFSPAPDSKAAKAKAEKEQLIAKHQIIEETDAEKDIVKKETNAIEKKLSNLQNLLEKQIQQPEREIEREEKAEEVSEQTQAYLKLIRAKMIDNEVEPAYVDIIMEDLQDSLKKETTLDSILSGIYQKIVLKIGQPHLIDIQSKKKKYIFFIGPTGVGKTTTIAKIASTLKLSKKANVALITSDTYRIAAVEQLKTYANILGTSLKVVYSAEEMAKATEELAEYDLVLIDTAGRSHNNKEQKEEIHKLLETVPNDLKEVFLVLSATTKYKDLVKITQSYSEITKYSLIFTKLDETDALGNLFNIRMLTAAPLSYVTYGQNVPDDIEKVDAQKIAKQLMGGE